MLKQNYTEGALVSKGDVIFEIDDRPFVAAVDQAKGELAKAQAQLGKASMDVERYIPLARENAISQQELDDAVQAKAAAEAQVQAATAVVEQAELNRGFTKVRAPIDGIAGIANAQIGDLVGPSTADLTTISSVDPIKAYFTLSEQDYLRYTSQYDNDAERDASEKKIEFELILSNGEVFPQRGQFLFADRQVDVRTGALRLAAQFPNPRNILRPGQFGRIRSVGKVRKGAMLVPQRAVTELQGTYLLALIGPDNKATIKPVKLGERVGSNWIVEEGVEPGDRVVVEGVQKVRDGTVVTAKPYTPPASESDKPKRKAKPATPKSPSKN